MNELIYLMRVAESEALFERLAEVLLVEEIPHFIRLATIAPLSNFGYKPDTEGTILALNEFGIVFGDPADTSVPKAFVPWQNVAYLAEGDSLKEQAMREEALLREEESEATDVASADV